jgi:hypothetical protein
MKKRNKKLGLAKVINVNRFWPVPGDRIIYKREWHNTSERIWGKCLEGWCVCVLQQNRYTQHTHTAADISSSLSLPFWADIIWRSRLSIVSSRTQIYIDFLDLVGSFRFGLYLFGGEEGNIRRRCRLFIQQTTPRLHFQEFGFRPSSSFVSRMLSRQSSATSRWDPNYGEKRSPRKAVPCTYNGTYKEERLVRIDRGGESGRVITIHEVLYVQQCYYLSPSLSLSWSKTCWRRLNIKRTRGEADRSCRLLKAGGNGRGRASWRRKNADGERSKITFILELMPVNSRASRAATLSVWETFH